MAKEQYIPRHTQDNIRKKIEINTKARVYTIVGYSFEGAYPLWILAITVAHFILFTTERNRSADVSSVYYHKFFRHDIAFLMFSIRDFISKEWSQLSLLLYPRYVIFSVLFKSVSVNCTSVLLFLLTIGTCAFFILELHSLFSTIGVYTIYQLLEAICTICQRNSVIGVPKGSY